MTSIRDDRALAALQGVTTVNHSHLRQVARPALSHRLRLNQLADALSAQV